jgi:uncharacterized protein (TIGR03000 family)
MLNTRARLIVEVPSDARLYVDDHLMKSTTEKRVFTTPQLRRGQTYYYILRAEVTRDGKPISESRRVTLRAGQSVRASFHDMDAVASKADAVAGR